MSLLTTLPRTREDPGRRRPVLRRSARERQFVPHPTDRSAGCDQVPAPTVDAAKEHFLNAKAAEALSHRTIKQYRWTLDRFESWVIQRGGLLVTDITAHQIREFLAELIARGCAKSYVHGFARVMRTWFRFLQDDEVIDENPMEQVRMPRVGKPIHPTFSRDDVDRLLDGCKGPRERAVVLLLLDTGLRAAELVHLTISDVDFKAGRVLVRRGKGDRDRVAFVSSRTIAAMQGYLEERGTPEPTAPFFPSARTGGPLTPNGLLQLCRKLGQRAGVSHCHPHTFRRTFATWSSRSGMGSHSLQQLMGHADPAVLQRYVILGEADLADAHRRYGPVDSVLRPDSAEDEPD